MTPAAQPLLSVFPPTATSSLAPAVPCHQGGAERGLTRVETAGLQAQRLATTTGVAAVCSLAVPKLAALSRTLSAPTLRHVLVGAGGLPANLATGLVLAAVIGAAIGSSKGPGALGEGDWSLFAAIAQGLALAPLFAQGLPVLMGPAGFVALGAVLGLTYCLTPQRPGPVPLRVGQLSTALICGVLVGPLGWDIAFGTAAAAAAGRAVYVGCLLFCARAIVAAVWQLQLHFAPTPYVQHFLSAPAQLRGQRLDLSPQPMAEPPTIFGVSAPLRLLIEELKTARGPLNEPFLGWHGVPVACLYGPGGTGKTLTAQGIAGALGAELAAVSSAELACEAIAFAPVAGLNILTLIAEAQLLGQRKKKPVVVFIDEVDNFLPISTRRAQSLEDINRVLNVALLHVTQRYLDTNTSHVLILFATNHVARIGPALGLLTKRAPLLLDVPDADNLARLLTSKCASAFAQHRAMGIDVPQFAEASARLGQMAQRMAEAGLSGRDAEAMIGSGTDALLAYVARRRAGRDPKPEEPLNAVFFAQLERHLRHTVDAAHARGPRLPPPLPQAIAPRSMRQYLQDAGMRARDAEQLIREALAGMSRGATDPGQQVRLGQVSWRALRSAWQLVAHATSHPTSGPNTSATRQFTDVPHR